MFQPNALKRSSLGTKDKNLKYNPDGSLTLYAGAKPPGKDKESNWLPAPEGTFSLYIRAYWADKAILDGTWQPPKVEMIGKEGPPAAPPGGPPVQQAQAEITVIVPADAEVFFD